MKRVVTVAAVVVALAAVAWFGVTQKKQPRKVAPLPYQASVAELPGPEQERFSQIRDQLRVAERQRAAAQQWPAEFIADPSVRWIRLTHGLYANYLGIPNDAARVRWLVLIIEPEPLAIRDPPPPDDDEHHTLSDGTGLHVSVWSGPNEGPVPEVVLPFPAAEGWTQRLRAP